MLCISLKIYSKIMSFSNITYVKTWITAGNKAIELICIRISKTILMWQTITAIFKFYCKTYFFFPIRLPSSLCTNYRYHKKSSYFLLHPLVQLEHISLSYMNFWSTPFPLHSIFLSSITRCGETFGLYKLNWQLPFNHLSCYITPLHMLIFRIPYPLKTAFHGNLWAAVGRGRHFTLFFKK